MIELLVESTIYTPYLHDIYDAATYGAPRGTFYQITRDTIPYQPRPTSFRLKTDRLDQPLKIYIEREEYPREPISIRDLADEYDITTSTSESVVNIILGLGVNKILIETTTLPKEEYRINVVVNDIHVIWVSFLRDFYTNVIRKVTDQKNAINSLYATRLVEPFLPIQDLLPQIDSLKSLTTRMALMGLIYSAGTNSGVDDLLKALTLGTPVYRPMDKDSFELDPAADPWTNISSQFYGTEAHAWIPNYGITKYVALIRYLAANPKNYSIVDLNEHQIRFKFQGRLRSHLFDMDKFGADYLQELARSECFNNIRVSILMESEATFRLKAASYQFDLVLQNPIGNARESLDIEVPFDSNLPFDSDTVDPFSDGWIGWSLSGRFEQNENRQLALDSFVCHTPPHLAEAWPYESHFVQALGNARSDIELTIDPKVTGSVV